MLKQCQQPPLHWYTLQLNTLPHLLRFHVPYWQSHILVYQGDPKVTPYPYSKITIIYF